MSHQIATRGSALRHLLISGAQQWWALGFGLGACFLVLLATKQFAAEARVFCALGAIVVIVMWLATGSFRRDGMACAASSTLALLPIAALECNWITIDDRGMVLLVETFCLAILFVGQLTRLGGEVTAMAQDVLRTSGGDDMPRTHPGAPQPSWRDGFANQSSTIVVRCCVILLGLIAAPSLVTAATAAVVG
jgi:hypothetical protein